MANDNGSERIPIEQLCLNGGTQPRVQVRDDLIDDYSEWLTNNPDQDLPAIDVIRNGELQWPYDGFHRIYGYQKAGRLAIPAHVQKGTLRDAKLKSKGANAYHGGRRTAEDKEMAVKDILKDDEWSKWSDRKIAEACAVGHPFVAKIRLQLESDSSWGENSPQSASDNGDAPKNKRARKKRTGKDGKARIVKNKPITLKTVYLCARCSRIGIASCKKCKEKKTPVPDPRVFVKPPDPESDREPGDETPEDAEPVKDAEGQMVPGQAIEAFVKADALTALCRDIDRIIREVEEIAKGPGGRLIRFDSFKQQMKDAKGNLWANRASHVCPYCHGKKEKCECCNGEGWTAKHVWQQAPGNREKSK